MDSPYQEIMNHAFSEVEAYGVRRPLEALAAYLGVTANTLRSWLDGKARPLDVAAGVYVEKVKQMKPDNFRGLMGG